MKEYITIKDFGPLKDIENLQLKSYTILIGESASGKSTLMKVVAMMRYLYKMANIRSYLKHSKITSSPFRVRFSTMMERQGMEKMLASNSIIDYSVVMNDETKYSVRIENNRMGALPIVRPEHLLFEKVSYISENRNIIPTWTQKASQNSGATLGYYFHETNTDFARASEKDKEIRLDYLGMKLQISHPKGKPTRYMVIPYDNRHTPIDLREASSGIQTSTSVALIVKDFADASNGFSFKDAFNRSVLNYLYDTYRLTKFKAITEPNNLDKKVFIHIEEPELSLYPDAQCKMIEDLFYTAIHSDADREINLMMATHSPYILNYLNIVLNQKDENRAKLTPENLAVYRIFDGETQDLLMQDEHGRWIVDTYDLSEMMNNIYREFVNMGI